MSDRPESPSPPALSPAVESRPYRPGVGLMLINRQGRVFVGRRIDMQSDAWQMPQGGIDRGETPQDAAKRELKEETGTDKAEFIAESRDWYHYELPLELQGRIWGGRYRGQRQKWFALRFTGSDADIDIHTGHAEFSQWQWSEIEALPRLIVPFKRNLYRALVDEFGHLAKPW